jgi:GNAT superfamily N-acetyltransferase
MTKAIIEVQKWSGPIGERFKLVATEVPAGLATEDPHRSLYDDRTIEIPSSNGSLWCDVERADGAAFVGKAVFAADAEVARCDTVDIMPQYRRQGLAAALYQLAADIFETYVVPTNLRSNDAIAFWGGRTEIRPTKN